MISYAPFSQMCIHVHVYIDICHYQNKQYQKVHVKERGFPFFFRILEKSSSTKDCRALTKKEGGEYEYIHEYRVTNTNTVFALVFRLFKQVTIRVYRGSPTKEYL